MLPFRVLGHAEPSQEGDHGASLGESGLKKVDAHEQSEKVEIRRNGVSQEYADHDHTPRDHSKIIINQHDVFLLLRILGTGRFDPERLLGKRIDDDSEIFCHKHIMSIEPFAKVWLLQEVHIARRD
jgi:hypothetical protein